MKNIISCLETANAENLDEQEMSGRKRAAASASSLTRRQAIAGVAAAFATVAAGQEVSGQMQPQIVHDTLGSSGSRTLTSLHQEASFQATPHRIYKLLLDSKEFAAFTSMKAKIDPKEGGAFSMFDGMIVGRTVEIIPNERIVQAWRPTHWDPGIYSIVKFELKPHGPETVVVLDHTGFPPGEYDHLYPGWKLRYWDPIKKFLAK